MWFAVPEPHVFEEGFTPTLTTTDNPEPKPLPNLATCKKCGLLRGGTWHTEADGQ